MIACRYLQLCYYHNKGSSCVEKLCGGT